MCFDNIVKDSLVLERGPFCSLGLTQVQVHFGKLDYFTPGDLNNVTDAVYTVRTFNPLTKDCRV